MSTATPKKPAEKVQRSAIQKIWHEIGKPFRSRRKKAKAKIKKPKPKKSKPAKVKPAPIGIAAFDPQSCTVEPEGLRLLVELVKDSGRYEGPIIEIGTLAGITATHMALAKAPRQKIITVDNYCWNPWQMPADNHYALAHQVLYYLIHTGQVEQVRMDKAEFFATYSGPAPSLVFLDAMHTYEETKKDIAWAMRVGAKLIAGHDYSQKFPGVMQIVEECGGCRQLGGTVWVLHPGATIGPAVATGQHLSAMPIARAA